MDSDIRSVVAGIIRHFITSFGGYLVATGVIHSGQVEGFVGASMVLVGIAWSWWQKVGQAQLNRELNALVEMLKARKKAT